MKIITRDNYARDLFTEIIIAENVNEVYGKEFVKLWNDKYWHDDSNDYLALVEDDYVPYDGYADLL